MNGVYLNNDEVNSLESLKNFLSNHDNGRNFSYISNIPDVCKEFPCVLGIDEAGRGPVLGPMVYGIAFSPINQANVLVELGCADSKVLTEEKRNDIFTEICKTNKSIGWAFEVISPNTICNSMLSRNKYSLNQVSMDAAIGLLRSAIKAGVNIAQVYVDTVGPPEKYEAYLSSIFPDFKITVAKKADSTYPIVSAASICAKVARDHALEVWTFKEGLELTQKDFGSGYPGDPTTKKFLVDHCDAVFGYPQLVRFSWATAVNALESTAYHVEFDDPDEEHSTSENNQTITSFFSLKKPTSITKRKHRFFGERKLARTAVTEF